MAIGFRALSAAAGFARGGGLAEEARVSRLALAGSFALSIGFTIVVFKLTPGLLADTLPVSGVAFVFVEAAIRVALLVAYLAALRPFPLLRRVLEYHAAEHKAINAYEDGAELTPEVVQRYPLVHPRCGTAFLLWVVLLSGLAYAPFGRLPLEWIVVTRIAFLSLVVGVAYELIRLAERRSGGRFAAVLLAPGLWLQRLTTREPTLEQLEVSIVALRRVLDLQQPRVALPARGGVG